MVPLALLALAQPELNCQDAAPPHNPHLHYRQRTKGWVGGGPHDCSYFHADPFACDTLRWADESDREEWEWDVANAKKKKAVEVGLDADSLKFEGVGP